MNISDFARRTPLKKDDLKDIPECISGEPNDFVERYLETLKLERSDRKKLVNDDPSFVERAFTLFKDAELGKLYVEKYGTSLDRHHTAYFISVELGQPIIRRFDKYRVI